MAKSSKKKSGDDDELFPDTGAKPAKKPTKKVEKSEVEKPRKTETKKVEKPAPAPEKTEDKPLKKSAPKPALVAESAVRSTSSPSGGSGMKLVAAAGIALVAIGGAAALMLPGILGEDTNKPKPTNKTAVVGPAQPNTPNTKLNPGEQPPMQQLPENPVVVGSTKNEPMNELKPLAPIKPQLRTDGKSAKELAQKTANHGAVARILDLFDAIRKVDFTQDNRLFEDYQQKQAREAELRAQIQALGMAGIDAIKDFVLNVNDDGYKIFLAKSLAEMKDPEALKAAAEILGSCHDIAVQTTLVRFLPESADATNVIAGAFGTEENPNVRSMLLREYSRRIGEPAEGSDPAHQQAGLSDQARSLFRKAALEDADPNVRAEAVSIIGHRGDARDMELMQQIAKGEQNLQIRQSAIVAYATTGQETSLPFLEDLAQHEDSLEIRASAVLAIARVGNDRAIQILDQIAQTDPREEIKTRA
ncbi:MAG: HEAT repeat domain-containing protein, partial [Planctomycetota bacterium]